VLHQRCSTRNWVGRRAVASHWKGAEQRANMCCINDATPSKGGTKGLASRMHHHAREVGEMLQHRRRAERKG
jgi:hypothetical protein